MNATLVTGLVGGLAAVGSLALAILPEESGVASPAIPAAVGLTLAGAASVASARRSGAARHLALTASAILLALAVAVLVGPWRSGAGTPDGSWLLLAGAAAAGTGIRAAWGRWVAIACGTVLAVLSALSVGSSFSDRICATDECSVSPLVALSTLGIGAAFAVTGARGQRPGGFLGRLLAPISGTGRTGRLARLALFLGAPGLAAASLVAHSAAEKLFGLPTGEAAVVAVLAAVPLGALAISPLLRLAEAEAEAKRRADGELMAMRAKLAAADGEAFTGHWNWDLGTNKQTWSPGIRELFGVAPDAPADLDLFRVIVHPEDRQRLDFDAVAKLEEGAEWRGAMRVVRPDRAVRSIESIGTVVTVDGRKHLVGFSRDVTAASVTPSQQTAASPPAEATDRQARDALQSFFLMAEARTRQSRGSVKSDGQVNEAAALLDAMIEVSALAARHQGAVPEDLSVGDIVDRVTDTLASQAREAGVEIRTAATGAACSSDPMLLGRLLSALLSDAISGTPRGGRVLVGLRRSGEGHDLVVAKRGPRGVGRNIERASPPGPAVAVALRVADLLGHPVEIRSGLTNLVSVRLPPARDPDAVPRRGSMIEALVAGRAGGAEGEGLTVVVIEDEPGVRDGIRIALESWGHKVIAGGAYDQVAPAVDALDVPPDVILADYHLADGLSGIDAVAGLREKLGWRIPGILLTGDVAMAETEASSRGGMPVLIKPMRVDDLRRAVVAAVAETPWTL